MAREAIGKFTEARLQILDSMEAELPQSRKELNKNAPRIHVQIDPEKIGVLIDLGGKNIRFITETTGATLTSTTTTLVAARYTENQEALAGHPRD